MTLNSRKEAAQDARRFLDRQPLYLDTETTGTGPDAEIIEIGIIDHDGVVLVDTLVKSVGRIEPDAFRVHGITSEMLSDAPSWSEVWPKVESAISGKLVGVYNLEFDLRMMEQSHKKVWLPWSSLPGDYFCVMKLYARFYGKWNPRYGNYRWQSLENAARQCNISTPQTHRAVDDVMLTRALLHHMAEWNARNNS
jgi:DNA polymerase-3 subunit epsilon